jgi:hypothetical protein
MIKKYLDKIVAIAAIVLAIVSLCMIFAPAATNSDLDLSYTGANLTFGYTYETTLLGTKISTKVFDFSANIVTLILLVVGIVALVLALLGKFTKVTPIVAAVALLVAGIFFFLMIQFCSPNTSSLSGDAKTEAIKNAKEALTLGAGAIVGGIFAILSALASASLLFIKKK